MPRVIRHQRRPVVHAIRDLKAVAAVGKHGKAQLHRVSHRIEAESRTGTRPPRIHAEEELPPVVGPVAVRVFRTIGREIWVQAVGELPCVLDPVVVGVEVGGQVVALLCQDNQRVLRQVEGVLVLAVATILQVIGIDALEPVAALRQANPVVAEVGIREVRDDDDEVLVDGALPRESLRSCQVPSRRKRKR